MSNIQEKIISRFPDLKIIKNLSGIIEIEAPREKLALVATELVNEYCLPLSLLFGTDDRKEKGTFGVHVVFSLDATHERLIVSSDIPENDASYPSITATVAAAHWYERYLFDMFGIEAKGHPDLRRLVHHENIPLGTFPLRKDFAWDTKLAHDNVFYPMHHVKGEGIFEIPVGPIHAGIIEPGHFRFNVAGERIINLEGKLFFTHKGVEKLLEGKNVFEGLPFIERLSGDMAVAHALAYSQAVESISGVNISKRAEFLRSLFLELERMTMHIHDLSNIGGMGTGYSFIAANGFRVKERMMRLSDNLLGNRFWRGLIIPGGVSKDFSQKELKSVLDIVKDAYGEIKKIVELALDSEGFLDRLQTTGVLPLEAAKAFGAVGLPARASGVDRDVRRDFPFAAYKEIEMPVIVKKNGDAHARYTARLEELQEMVEFMEKVIKNIPEGEVKGAFEVADGFSLGAVESWRGEILCVLKIKNGVIERIFPRDPSFCNWALFGIMGPGNIVPDFPLINKTLNLSYSGNDM